MVERAALEMRYTRKRIEGSNPPLSAKRNKTVCPSLLEQAVLFLFCKDAVGRLRGLRRNPSLLGCRRQTYPNSYLFKNKSGRFVITPSAL